MFHKEWQVCLTYLTQRWLWFFGLAVASLVGGGYSSALTFGGSRNPAQASLIIFPLAVPILMGGAFLVSVVKWQFANPRARLIPGFAGPHLLVLGAILVVMLLLNPLLLTLALGIPAWGPLAFTLLIGGGHVWAIGANRTALMIPVLALFFFSMTEAGKNFWFLAQEPYLVRHGLLAILGAALVGGWLWRLVHLNEEMDDYQVQPDTGWNRASRLDSAEQRKLEGRQAARKGIGSWLSDRWHDRLPQRAETTNQKMAILRYGFTKHSPTHQAVGYGCSLVIFALVMIQIQSLNAKSLDAKSLDISSFLMPLIFALGIPLAAILTQFTRRRIRLAHELFYPLSRNEYFEGLLLASGRQLCLFWLANQIALGFILYLVDIRPTELNFQSLATFSLFSAVSLPSGFGCILWLARYQNRLALFLGIYLIAIAQTLLLTLWWRSPFSVGLLLLGFMLVLGVVLIAHARQKWLDTELG